MGRPTDRTFPLRGELHRRETGQIAVDRWWAVGARWAVYGAVVFLGLTTLFDWGSGGLTGLRIGLWATLGAMVFAVALPPRVTAGEGWLAVRTFVRTNQVRTDALVEVRRSGAIAMRLVLTDAYGGCVEVDPRILIDNPLLWHLLDAGARRSIERGTLLSGSAVLKELDERISGEAARAVFTASGMR
ncbi:hypothetical protein NGB36_11605 [Streptomyces sp. RB6PN25]|uniref:Integral membrane protein n=1 Tax=Streptomyces humicola TaxID=2953240 RepID=A0ABT1PU67_9ACTN|nr:hypothetical protein [Streptomyces humicola]MCQ4081227.1 hypothetical protein [Streptomyces humicola]